MAEQLPALKKDISLIQVEGKTALLQRKIYNALLAHAQQIMVTTGKDVPSFSVSRRQVCEALGISYNDTASLKRHLVELKSIQIQYNVFEHNQGKPYEKWGTLSPISQIEMDENLSLDGLITYELPSRFRSIVRNPEIYGLINPSIVGRLGSKHSLALYELCSAAARKREKQTEWISVEHAHRFFGTSNTKSLQRFAVFNDRVIKKAVAEINAETDLVVETKLQRIGRSVRHISWVVKYKDQAKGLQGGPVTYVSQEEKAKAVLGREFSYFLLVDRNFDAETAFSLLRDHADAEIQQTVFKTDKSRNDHTLKSFLAYFLKTLRQETKESTLKSQETLDFGFDDSPREDIQALSYQRSIVQLYQLKLAALEHYIANVFSHLSEEQVIFINTEFENRCCNGHVLSFLSEETYPVKYERYLLGLQKGFYLPFVVEDFQSYLAETKPDIDLVLLLGAASLRSIKELF